MKLNGFTTKRVLREAAKGGVARDVPLERRTAKSSVFNQEAVERLLDAHRSGSQSGGDAIWALMNLELWYRTFIDGEGIQTLPQPRTVDPGGRAAA